MEIWKRAIYNGEDIGNWIEVSNLSRIRNPKTGTIRKQNILKTGYWFVSFSMGSRKSKRTIRVHRAVAETFILNINNSPIINHIDGNKLNNSIENLEWCTYSENAQHAYDIGLTPILKGEQCSISKLNDQSVKFIRENYKSHDRVYGSRAMGRKFNVDKTTILSVVNRETWNSI